MLAYCDREEGIIHIAEKRPRGALLIAEHADKEQLRGALISSGAHTASAMRRGKLVTVGLAVPWFVTAKFPEDQDEVVAKFAARVRQHLVSQTSLRPDTEPREVLR